jgi:hypothetical protein
MSKPVLSFAHFRNKSRVSWKREKAKERRIFKK